MLADAAELRRSVIEMRSAMVGLPNDLLPRDEAKKAAARRHNDWLSG